MLIAEIYFFINNIMMSYHFNMTLIVKCLTIFGYKCSFRIKRKEWGVLSIYLIFKEILANKPLRELWHWFCLHSNMEVQRDGCS